MTYAPFKGVRIIDVSRLYPGALATRKLADFGADVVKVEEPGRGDYMRTIPPLVPGGSALHVICNRGKRSVALDLKTDEGRATFHRLAMVADAIVEGARPGRFGEIGVDFSALREERPQLVVCSVSGFGQTGPLAPLASHGMNMDTLAGVAVVEDHEGRKKLANLGFSLGVEMGAVNAALGIAVAVFGARATGEGGWIDASCWDGAFEITRLPVAAHLGGTLPLSAPREPRPLYDLYEASDGNLVLLCAIERKFWQSFCRGVGREDMATRWSGTDVDFGEDRSLRRELEEIFSQKTAEEWQKLFLEWDIPGSRVPTLEQTLESPHMQARGLVAVEEDGTPVVRNPLRWHHEGIRPGADAPRAPELGEHTDAVLAEWLGGS